MSTASRCPCPSLAPSARPERGRDGAFDNRAPDEWRADLWRLIRGTPALVWLVLTKRPQNFRRMLPADWGDSYPNVWLGVSAENQREADRRLPLLCRTPAARRFVSAEPLLEPVDLRPWLGPVSWVITGCESLMPGKRPGRPMADDWARDLRDQCGEALKQAARDGKVVELPELDGRVWRERPAPLPSPKLSSPACSEMGHERPAPPARARAPTPEALSLVARFLARRNRARLGAVARRAGGSARLAMGSAKQLPRRLG